MNTLLPHRSQRQPVLARNVIATSQPLASQAGAAAFARGGNAIDAILAAAITLTVVEPTMNGIGGDAFALIWADDKLHGLNASGRAPAGWTPDRFKGQARMPDLGWDTVTVPGAVSSWVALSERFGQLPFDSLFADAIRHARDGYPVSPVIARQWAESAAALTGQPGFDAFLARGRAPRAGEIWSFADQAATLEEIARTRGESFYRGRLGQAIADFAVQHGGAMKTSDLAAHRCDWVDPIGIEVRGHKVWEIPPNGQGIGALIALGMLEHLPYDDTAPGSAARLHLEVEVMRAAFADLAAHIADPAHMRFKPEALLDPAYLRQRAKTIRLDRAGQYEAGQPHTGGTVYLCAADAQGRMVSLIQSNYHGFGSGLVVPGTGIALHNRGRGFVTTPGHPRQAALPHHHPGLHDAPGPARDGLRRDGRQHAGARPPAGHAAPPARSAQRAGPLRRAALAHQRRPDADAGSRLRPRRGARPDRARPRTAGGPHRQPGLRQRAGHRAPGGRRRLRRAALCRRVRPAARRPGGGLLSAPGVAS